MVNILYFASFREMLGQADEQLPVQHSTVGALISELALRGDHWKQALLENANLQIAVNHDIASRETVIKSGDEVAFFPPVTGG